MVFRPTADRHILDLQNAESATAWILSLVAKCRAEKKRDKINTDRTVRDLQVINLFLSTCGQDAIIKFRRLVSPMKLIDTLYKDIRLAIQNYISPKETVVTVERAKFLSVIQVVGESDYDHLARLREEARCFDCGKLKTAANPEKELTKIKFISGLRVTEAKLRLLDGIQGKPTMSNTEMTESLQFRSYAMIFASSSSGNNPFTGKEEVGLNFKKTFRKRNEKFTAKESNNLCTRCGGKPRSIRPCPALSKKCNTCEKVQHFSKMCRSKPQPNSDKYNEQKKFCKENISSGQASPLSEMGMLYTNEQIFCMSATWE